MMVKGEEIPVHGLDVVWHPRMRDTGGEIPAHGCDEVWDLKMRRANVEIPGNSQEYPLIVTCCCYHYCVKRDSVHLHLSLAFVIILTFSPYEMHLCLLSDL